MKVVLVLALFLLFLGALFLVPPGIIDATSRPAELQAAAFPTLAAPSDGEFWREKAASKMDAGLLAQLRNQASEPITVMVHLGGEADLSGAAALSSRAQRGDFVYQVLQAFAAEKQASLRAHLDQAQRAGSVIAFRPYFIINGIAVTAQPEFIWEMALRDDVEAITANHSYQLDEASPTGGVTLSLPQGAEWNISQIQADAVWASYGITGSGVLVANMDSGVQYDHPALIRQYAGNLGGAFDHDFHWYDATGASPLVPLDDNGHGTHTMGTMVGGDGPGPFADDVGVAPGASWIAAKAFSAGGTGQTDDIHAAFEWLLAPCPAGVQPGDPSCDPARAPQLVNNSWGSSNGARIEFLPDVQALRAAGIWPAFSAGNSGPGAGTIGSPASFAESFATGATTSSDLIASFSAWGPSPLTEEIKPDVVAPGVDIRSSIPTNNYGVSQGTSMACPHSVGTAALLLSAAPDLTLDLLEEMVRSTALDLGDPGPDMIYGYGRIDALRAMQRLLSSGDLSGMVRDADSLSPLPEVEVRVWGQGLETAATTNASGVYTMTYLVNGYYTVTAASYSYYPVTLTNVSVVTGQVTIQDIELPPRPHFTLSGHIYDAISTTVPITHAVVQALDTPVAPAPADVWGFYSMTVASGPVVIEAAAFGYATGITATEISSDTVIDFYLDRLPPILLVDDDEGDLRDYSPHVEERYFMALDSNGYHYDYWDIEALGSPDFDTVRQYAAVVWFGGEFGRIKDISDADQAQVIMDYLDLGGRFLYVAQEHTFYYGDDAICDTPTWGGSGPCPFTRDYLGIADWVEDQKAQVNYGVAGNPVGDGLGPILMDYPTALTDFSDDIAGTVAASLAFSATDSPGEVNLTAYTLVSPTLQASLASGPFRTVFFATPLEAMPPPDAADVMYAVMEWFGVSGLAEGLTLAPSMQAGRALPGETISLTVRLRNLSAFSDTFMLSVEQAPWATAIWDATFSQLINQIGPVPPGATADFGVTVAVPVSAEPGAEAMSRVRATSQSGTPHFDEAELLAQALMAYYWLDSDQCDSGIHFEWVDATMGDRWDLDDDGSLPEYVSVTLPQPFTFYNWTYDHLWINDHGTVLLGDDNIYDDNYPSGEPPIPNPTIMDPNSAIYLAWGTSFWHPSYQDPDSAVYTYYDNSAGRNWFIVEYYLYENLLGGGPDTFEVILDLDTHEITVQYLTVTYSSWAVVGIENQAGTEGILYVNDMAPPENTLHDNLALHFGLGEPPDVIEVWMNPPALWGTGIPDGVVTYTLVVSSTSSIVDSYALEAVDAVWPTTLWDPTFSTPISSLGPLDPCTSAQLGVKVELPPDAAYVLDQAIIRARSQADTLIAASSTITTDNASPAVAAGPDAAGSAFSGQTVQYGLWVTNTGNITDRYDLTLSGYSWPTEFAFSMTETGELAPGAFQGVEVQVIIPASAYAGETDHAVLAAVSQRYADQAVATAHIDTEAAVNVAVQWEERYQEKTGMGNWTVGYYGIVRNKGNTPDSFVLAAVAADWETTLWNDNFTRQITKTATLGPDETQRIGMRVLIPAGASPPQQDAALIRAGSSRDNEVADHCMLVTAVTPEAPGDYGVALAPAGSWQLASAGQVLTYGIGISNTGSTADSYTLMVRNNLWPTRAPTSTTWLLPGAGEWVEVVVEVLNSAGPGELDDTILLASSQGSPAVSDQANMISMIPGTSPGPLSYSLYLPLLLRGP